MPLPIPPELTAHDCYKPVVDLLRDRLITPRQLSERWGYSVDHLANLRRGGHGLPFIRLPLGPKATKGGIRYRLSDVVAAELVGGFGQVSISRVELAIASCPTLSEAQRAAVQAHLRAVLAGADSNDEPAIRPPNERRGRPPKRS